MVSSGRPRPPRTRSKVATGTTTGGRGSTPRGLSVPSRAATPVTPGTAESSMSQSSPNWDSPVIGSRSSGAASSPSEVSGPRRPGPLPPLLRGAARGRSASHRHLPPFHEPAVDHRPRRLDGSRHRGKVCRVRPPGRRAPRRRDVPGLHVERAEHGRRHGLSHGTVPARCRQRRASATTPPWPISCVRTASRSRPYVPLPLASRWGSPCR